MMSERLFFSVLVSGLSVGRRAVFIVFWILALL